MEEIVLFKSTDGEVSLPVSSDGDTVWLSQAQMAELFGKDRTVVGKHIKNAIEEGEIDPKVVCANFAHTTHYDELAIRVSNSVNYCIIVSTTSRGKPTENHRVLNWASVLISNA